MQHTAWNIAHRGASAYAPEHTTHAYRLALGMGADYVEPDLCITRDGVLVVSHDPTLERTTDVAEIFPERKPWFVEDFTLAEIERLDKGAWFDPRFAGSRVLTFQDAIDLVRGNAGIIPELKTPARLRAKGFDMEAAVAGVLEENGLAGGDAFEGRPAVYLQCFEEDSLRRLAKLLPNVPRTFLLDTVEDAARWLTSDALDDVRTFATAVSPAKRLVTADPGLVDRAHSKRLAVIPYTFQQTAEMRRFIEQFKVDGLFTDNPDLFPR